MPQFWFGFLCGIVILGLLLLALRAVERSLLREDEDMKDELRSEGPGNLSVNGERPDDRGRGQPSRQSKANAPPSGIFLGRSARVERRLRP
jgi:hypothetical protein